MRRKMSSLQFSFTTRGHPLLIYDGRSYTLKRTLQNMNKRWICRDSKCKGTLLTFKDTVLEEGNHICIPDVAKVEIQKSILNCKKRAREELTPMNEIYKSAFSPIIDKGLNFVAEIPKFESIKSALYKNRHNALGSSSLPKERENITLPEHYKENFLIIDDGDIDRILIFCTEEGGKSLIESTKFFGDGTFKSCCPQFKQLYTIHVDLANKEEEVAVLPAIYALLPDKKEETYARLLKLLTNHFPSWSPQFWKIDFEMAMYHALKNIFPTSEVKGCNFHFNQCIWRKVQELGLVKDYIENEEIKMHVRMLAALAYIPPDSVDEGFIKIMENSPATETIAKFNDYMVEQWIDNPNIEHMWNCYMERHRTTNALESWHSALNRSIRKSHPNILELIIKLKEDAKFNDMRRLQLKLNMPAKKRQRKYLLLDDRIQKTVSDFETGKKTLIDCLSSLSYIVKLQ